jgi:hypothetical protein
LNQNHIGEELGGRRYFFFLSLSLLSPLILLFLSISSFRNGYFSPLTAYDMMTRDDRANYMCECPYVHRHAFVYIHGIHHQNERYSTAAAIISISVDFLFIIIYMYVYACTVHCTLYAILWGRLLQRRPLSQDLLHNARRDVSVRRHRSIYLKLIYLLMFNLCHCLCHCLCTGHGTCIGCTSNRS